MCSNSMWHPKEACAFAINDTKLRLLSSKQRIYTSQATNLANEFPA